MRKDISSGGDEACAAILRQVAHLRCLNGSRAGIEKFSLVSGIWTSSGTVTGTGFGGLTASANGSTVSLFATSRTAIFSLTDSSGYNAASAGTLTSIVTAGANTAFRGLDFAPIPEPSTLASFLAFLAAARRRR